MSISKLGSAWCLKGLGCTSRLVGFGSLLGRSRVGDIVDGLMGFLTAELLSTSGGSGVWLPFSVQFTWIREWGMQCYTRRFSNHKSRLLSWSHTFAVNVISDLTHTKTWTKGHWPVDDLWPQDCWGHMCDTTQGSLCPSSMKIHQSMWIQWSFFQNLEPNVIDP